MEKQEIRRNLKTRVLRPGMAGFQGEEWPGGTVEERIEAVWELTLLCQAWNREGGGEPRLDRTVGRVQRPGG